MNTTHNCFELWVVRAIEDSTSTEKCEWSSEPMGLLAAQGSGDIQVRTMAFHSKISQENH